GVVWLDNDPGVDLRWHFGGGRFGHEGNVEAEGEAAGSGGGSGDEGTAVDFGQKAPGGLPPAFTTAWNCARTRWKVPHRQMLVMAASISASVGFGFSLRRTATAMIIPLWQ